MTHQAKPTCQQFQQDYHALVIFKRKLEAAFQAGIPTKNFVFAKRLRKALAPKVRDLQERVPITYHRAKELMGEEMLGQEEVEKAFGTKIAHKEIPRIPFTRKELEKAKELGEKLILRMPGYTIASLIAVMKERAYTDEVRKQGGIRLLVEGLNKKYFAKDKTKLEWVLVSSRPLEHSYAKTSPVQLKILIDYLEHVIYKSHPLPEKYQAPITNFKKEYEEKITALIGISKEQLETKTDQEIDDLIYEEIDESSWRLKLISWLKEQPVVSLFTHSPVEWYYDACLRYLHANTSTQQEKLKNEFNNYTRIFYSPLHSNTYFLRAGVLSHDGFGMENSLIDHRRTFLGISFSRR